MAVHFPKTNFTLNTQIPTPIYSPEIEQQLSSMRNISSPQNRAALIASLDESFTKRITERARADLAASIQESTERMRQSIIADLNSQSQSLALNRQLPLSSPTASRVTVPQVTVSQAERIGVVVVLIIPMWAVTTGIVECFACRFTVVSKFKTAISISGTTALAILTYANPPMGFVAYGMLFVGFLLVAGIGGFPSSLQNFKRDDYQLPKYDYKLNQQLAQIAYENLRPRLVSPPINLNLRLPLYPGIAQRPYVPYIFGRHTTEALNKPPIPKAAGGKNYK